MATSVQVNVKEKSRLIQPSGQKAARHAWSSVFASAPPCVMYILSLFVAPLPYAEQEVAFPTSTPAVAIATTGQICHIRVIRQHLRHILLRLNSPDLNQAISTLRYRLGDDLRRLTLSLCSDDVRLPLLLRLLHYEPTSLRVLLRDLLLFDGAGEFLAEGHMRDGDVFEGDVEFGGALEEVGADAIANGFTLSDEFGGVKLGHDGFEDFVADGGEDTFIVVLAEILNTLP